MFLVNALYPFQMVYLYNELAALRRRAESAEKYQTVLDEIQREAASALDIDKNALVEKITAALSTPKSDNGKVTADAKPQAEAGAEDEKGSAVRRALSRKHKMVQVFSSVRPLNWQSIRPNSGRLPRREGPFG